MLTAALHGDSMSSKVVCCGQAIDLSIPFQLTQCTVPIPYSKAMPQRGAAVAPSLPAPLPSNSSTKTTCQGTWPVP